MSQKRHHIEIELEDSGESTHSMTKKLKLERDCFDDQLREQSLLKEIFLREISPTELCQYCVHMGFPERLLQRICSKHPTDASAVMSEVFDTWYPVAEVITEANDLAPRFMLAKASYQQQNSSAFVLLIDNFFWGELFGMSNELFENLASEILAALSKDL